MRLDTLYTKYFGQSYLCLPEVKRASYIRKSLGMCFQLMSHSEFLGSLKLLDGDHRAFKSHLLVDGYILKNIKGYLLDVAYSGKLTDDGRQRLASTWEVEDSDVGLADYLTGPLLRGLHGYQADGYKNLTLKRLDHNLRFLLQEVDVFTRKFVYRKMTFIVRSNGMEYEDLTSELLSKAIQGILLTYPRISSKEHFLNIARRIIHNHGINIIHKYTSQSRARLQQNPDGTFGGVLVELGTSALNPEFIGALACGMDGSQEWGADVGSKIDLRLSVDSILCKLVGRKRQFADLLMGYNAEFTEFLRRRGLVCNGECNEDLMEGDRTVYIRQAMAYTQISQQTGQETLNDLRAALSGCVSCVA